MVSCSGLLSIFFEVGESDAQQHNPNIAAKGSATAQLASNNLKQTFMAVWGRNRENTRFVLVFGNW